MEEAFAAIERADKVDEYEPLMNEAADKLNDILDMEAQAEA
ncbi:hypothetical protein JCM19237_353 [Photobacterium aphoticum]|uniref:Uncharacterized protein n=1 Tax=Photobacterium aphoticum TaxID=754436 RepID=A0A090R0G1_9GAMM|nr:hypothetical protein JCM19237_353 [Photobacterium aphoticum]